MILCQRHVCYYSERGGSWWKLVNFMIRGGKTRLNGRLRSKFAALTHNGGSAMTHRALLLSFQSWARRVIMVAERKRAKKKQNYLWQWRSSLSRAQDPDVRSWRPAQITQLRYQGLILCQRHVCYYSERGDLLLDRFARIMKWGISWLEAVRQGQMDVSEANSLRWRTMVAQQWLTEFFAFL